jgi:hypothetical protein
MSSQGRRDSVSSPRAKDGAGTPPSSPHQARQAVQQKLLADRAQEKPAPAPQEQPQQASQQQQQQQPQSSLEPKPEPHKSAPEPPAPKPEPPTAQGERSPLSSSPLGLLHSLPRSSLARNSCPHNRRIRRRGDWPLLWQRCADNCHKEGGFRVVVWNPGDGDIGLVSIQLC